jgi:hypothetical protein
MINYMAALQSVLAFFFGLYLLVSGYGYASDELKISEVYEILRFDNKINSDRDRLNAAYSSLESISAQRDEVSFSLLYLALDLGKKSLTDSTNISESEVKNLNLAGKRVIRYSPMAARAWCVLAFSSVQANSINNIAIEQLRACYLFGPYEDELVGGRLALIFSAWDQLPEDLRVSAISEVAYGLREPQTRSATIQRLALVVATVAPQQHWSNFMEKKAKSSLNALCSSFR